MGAFEETGRRIGALVDKKNEAYGDSYRKTAGILRVLYPEGIRPDQYRDLGGIVRVLDKLCRIASGNTDAFGEDAWVDIAGYGIRGARPMTGHARLTEDGGRQE